MIIDLTKSLDTTLIPFTSGKYSDPPLEISPWCDISEEGFRVSKLSLGTQTGTHIDAPAHFVEGGATLEALDMESCLGKFFLLDLGEVKRPAGLERRMSAYRQEKILLIRTPENSIVKISHEALQKILSRPPRLIVLSGEIEIEGAGPFEFHRMIARAGKFLAEDLDQKAASRLTGKEEIYVIPLRLTGVSGSPCRVLVRKVK